jgi:hypothetical protein
MSRCLYGEYDIATEADSSLILANAVLQGFESEKIAARHAQPAGCLDAPALREFVGIK